MIGGSNLKLPIVATKYVFQIQIQGQNLSYFAYQKGRHCSLFVCFHKNVSRIEKLPITLKCFWPSFLYFGVEMCEHVNVKHFLLASSIHVDAAFQLRLLCNTSLVFCRIGISAIFCFRFDSSAIFDAI